MPALRPIIVSLLLISSLLPSLPAQAGGAILVRSGALRLDDTSQVFDGVLRDLDTWSHSVFSISIEGRKRNGISLGAEYLSYRNDFSPPAGNTGETRAKIIQFIVKKYFLDSGVFHPFIGFGMGGGETEFNYTQGGIDYSDSSFTAAVQLNVGAELRFDSFLVTIEGKHIAHDIDKGWNDFNASSTGLFAGVGFSW